MPHLADDKYMRHTSNNPSSSRMLLTPGGRTRRCTVPTMPCKNKKVFLCKIGKWSLRKDKE